MNIRNSVIGFIGLGAMGSRMAKRLIDANFKVVVFDRTRGKLEALAAQGAAIAPNVRTLAMEADVIMSCLFNDDAVKEVYGGDEGIVLSAASGNIIIEMSTISPETSRGLRRMGKARDLEVLDVAISGGPQVAEQGALTLLAGGSESAFDVCAPIFSTIAKQYFLLGPSGSGTSMKLVVNAIMGGQHAGHRGGRRVGRKIGTPARSTSEGPLADRRRGAGTAKQAATRSRQRLPRAVSDLADEQGLPPGYGAGSGDRSTDASHFGRVPDEPRAGGKTTRPGLLRGHGSDARAVGRRRRGEPRGATLNNESSSRRKRAY